MKNILVTGCKGQLGNEIQLLAPKYEDECTFFFTDKEELDITDRKAVYTFIEKHSIGIVINCAAFTAVDKAEENEELCNLLNNVAPGYLAEAVASVGGTMIQVSTDYVFDGKGCIPYKEEDATNPQTVYGRTKLAGEENVIRSCAGSMVIRTAWLYSTFGNNFVKTMIRLGKERDALGVVFDQVGSPTYARTWLAPLCTLWIKALCRGYITSPMRVFAHGMTLHVPFIVLRVLIAKLVPSTPKTTLCLQHVHTSRCLTRAK